MEDCIFCKILKGEIPSDKVYEDDFVYAFNDISPQAPTHILVIPKVHIETIDMIDSDSSKYVAKVYEAIAKIAKEKGLDNGFRVISNCKEDGGQTVYHIHFHILGGKKLSEKML